MALSKQQPRKGAPPGTLWFGGEVDRCKVTLRVIGASVNPDDVTRLLGCSPTRSESKGNVRSSGGVAKDGHWALTLSSDDLAIRDLDALLQLLLSRLPADPAVWKALSVHRVDVFCGLFLEAINRGVSLKPHTLRLLADRNLELGLDIYAPESARPASPRPKRRAAV